MNKEYLNVILVDDDEGNQIFFKNIFKDLKVGVKVQIFNNGRDLMNFLNSEDALIPEILFMKYDIPKKNSLECLEEIKIDFRFDQMVNVIYSDELSVGEEEDVFVKGANVFMKKPDNYADMKKVLSEIITINWQYHTSGLNKNNFIMKV
ncbi:CheY chemotaxis protein or a CheY-like REC (receiver) domain [Chryseobacterium wanjuense]|uniref:CheY chemotaxis protein or a CheY-like REC (Receiver) domain n=1 Tax=Chryseobacterium wanjuense TaxID=356305 RepID=A0A1I0S3C6_9FLAO|nr:response regulator [Chryseobacterium wanjuense]SEW49181.1 CheY chemotaxis protein or a CheY-like REC (receiver) domain [Chryseobacterium wanjuense]